MGSATLKRENVNWTLGALCTALVHLVATPAAADEPDDVETAETEEEATEADPTSEEGASTDEDGRFRWGISGLAGPYMGAYRGGAGGIDARFGWQFNDNWALVGQPQLALGIGVQGDEDSATVSATALSGISAIVDYTAMDMFYAGAGLGFSSGGFVSGSIDDEEGEAKAATGPFFDIPFRFGIALGDRKSERRNAFTIGINGHLLVVSNDVSSVDADGETSTNRRLGLVLLPLLALGFESY